jgi:hypothetical protein
MPQGVWPHVACKNQRHLGSGAVNKAKNGPGYIKGGTDMSDADDAIRDQTTSYIESLLSELYEPEGVQIWMTSPHRWFGGRRAVDLTAEGRAEEVLAAANRLIDGAGA